jgi:hypothetical protein
MSYTEYRRVLGELAQAQARRRVEFKAAMDWYDGEMAARTGASEDARSAVEEATAAARAAAAAVRHTDDEAEATWARVARHLGRHANYLMGDLPEPEAPAEAGQAAPAGDPGRYLRRAEGLLDRARVPRPLDWWGYPVLVLIGAGFAVLSYITAESLLALGGPFGSGWGGVVTMAGYLLKLASPLAGLPLGKLFCDRAGAHFHAGAISLVIFGGMVAVTAMMMLVR